MQAQADQEGLRILDVADVEAEAAYLEVVEPQAFVAVREVGRR